MKSQCEYRCEYRCEYIVFNNNTQGQSASGDLKRYWKNIYRLLEEHRKKSGLTNISLHMERCEAEQYHNSYKLIISFHCSENYFKRFINSNEIENRLSQNVQPLKLELYQISMNEYISTSNTSKEKFLRWISSPEILVVSAFVIAVVVAGLILFLRTPQ